MALKGTLRDFSVADIFQLIGQQQKSGSLYVRTKEKRAHIVFDAGKLVLGTFQKTDEDFLLGTMLLRAGGITSDQLNEAIADQKTSLRSLGDILVGMGAIDQTVLYEFVQLQLKEVLFRLFQWKDGLYEFVPEQIRFKKTVIKPQLTEKILMDCFRMLDEWPAVSRKIVTTANVFRSLVDPAELAEETPPKEEGAPTPEDKKILRLLDGHRSLAEVIYLARLGTFETCRIVAGLMDRGSVMKLDQLSQTRVVTAYDFQQSSTWAGWFSGSYRFLLAVFGLSLLLPVAAFGVRSHFSSRFGEYNPAVGRKYQEDVSLQTMKRNSERKLLENLLELSRLERGEYPGSLDEIPFREIPEIWDYARKGESYALTYRESSYD